jgi:hypothetical protein
MTPAEEKAFPIVLPVKPVGQLLALCLGHPRETPAILIESRVYVTQYLITWEYARTFLNRRLPVEWVGNGLCRRGREVFCVRRDRNQKDDHAGELAALASPPDKSPRPWLLSAAARLQMHAGDSLSPRCGKLNNRTRRGENWPPIKKAVAHESGSRVGTSLQRYVEAAENFPKSHRAPFQKL